jgi:hypothetical protein
MCHEWKRPICSREKVTAVSDRLLKDSRLRRCVAKALTDKINDKPLKLGE